jgi:hypothetical protein
MFRFDLHSNLYAVLKSKALAPCEMLPQFGLSNPRAYVLQHVVQPHQSGFNIVVVRRQTET